MTRTGRVLLVGTIVIVAVANLIKVTEFVVLFYDNARAELVGRAQGFRAYQERRVGFHP